MSRIGRLPVTIPPGVTVKIDNNRVTVKGPRGEIFENIYPDLNVRIVDSTVVIEAPDSPVYEAIHGTARAKINNMVRGVTQGFTRVLEIEGVGYRGEMQGKNLVLSLGFSHTIPVEPPPGITLSVDKTQRVVTIDGPDRQVVGQLAANIRRLRPPEPYKGKGVRYQGEKIRRKAGKAGKAGAK